MPGQNVVQALFDPRNHNETDKNNSMTAFFIVCIVVISLHYPTRYLYWYSLRGADAFLTLVSPAEWYW